MLKGLQLSIPFTDVLKEMSTYKKFLKEILFNKRKVDEFLSVSLTTETSTVIQTGLPPKHGDPRQFTMTI